MKVGVIGQGFVGSAIRNGLQNEHKMLTYDIDSDKCNSSHEKVCNKADIIFVCLPTPMRKNGSCDTRILENAIDRIYSKCKELNRTHLPALIIKSTVPPGTTTMIDAKYSDMLVTFSPEFLTEANSFDDFKNQNRIIVGLPDRNAFSYNEKIQSRKIRKMFETSLPESEFKQVISEEAEMCKYYINCFLATKVIFANQMSEICNASNINHDNVANLALLDNRIGNSHLMVPGPDGDRGYGGHCFPKDIASMSFFGEGMGVDTTFLTTVEEMNKMYRTNKDWLEMKGRAVSDD